MVIIQGRVCLLYWQGEGVNTHEELRGLFEEMW